MVRSFLYFIQPEFTTSGTWEGRGEKLGIGIGIQRREGGRQGLACVAGGFCWWAGKLGRNEWCGCGENETSGSAAGEMGRNPDRRGEAVSTSGEVKRRSREVSRCSRPISPRLRHSFWPLCLLSREPNNKKANKDKTVF